MAAKQRLLLTGAAGRIAAMLSADLRESYALSGIDIRPADGMACHLADMADYGAIRPAFEGQDIVVDLANDSAGNLPWERAYGNNIPSTFNALRAACEAGVKRYIYTSSNRVVEGYELDAPYAAICRGAYEGLDPADLPLLNTSMPVRPNGPYGIAKACGEAAARYFSDQHGMSVICLRLGTVDRGDGRPRAVRQFATLLTCGDLVRLYRCAIAAPDELRFATFFGVSNNTWRFWDISDADRLIGFRPQDNTENWRGKVHFPPS
jgi:NAD+ dependent glucose-6-phosphate dehydrogenase